MLQLEYEGKPLSWATVFRRFTEFRKGQSSLLDEEYIGRFMSAIIPENVSAIRNVLIDDNRFTFQMIQKKLYIGSAAMHKIIHEGLNMKKKLACRWVPHDLTEH